MKLFLDTNVLIAVRDRDTAVTARFGFLQSGDAALSSIVYGELRYGIARSKSVRSSAFLDRMLLFLPFVAVDHAVADHC